MILCYGSPNILLNLLDKRYSSGFVIVAHCSFTLNSSNDKWDWESSYVFSSHAYNFFRQICTKTLSHFKTELFVQIWVGIFLLYLRYQFFIRYIICNYFLSVSGLALFFMSFFYCLIIFAIFLSKWPYLKCKIWYGWICKHLWNHQHNHNN